MNIETIVRAVQANLGIPVDGKDGPITWAAIYKRITGRNWENEQVMPEDQIKPNLVSTLDASKVDERSEKAIATLLPEVQPYARALVNSAKERGIKLVVTSGTRTYAEQDELYEQGRSKPGKIVTNARGGYSNHNFGIAFDVTIFNGSTPVWESPLYKVVGALGERIGLTWGGGWKAIQDEPHFELHPDWSAGLSESDFLAELRKRKTPA